MKEYPSGIYHVKSKERLIKEYKDFCVISSNDLIKVKKGSFLVYGMINCKEVHIPKSFYENSTFIRAECILDNNTKDCYSWDAWMLDLPNKLIMETE